MCASAGFVDNDGDSDDTDASINPDADEVCGDGIDNNSDGQVDEGCAGFCGATDCTALGTCLSDDYSDVQGELSNAIVNFLEPDTFTSVTSGGDVCYAVPAGGTGNNVIVWVGPVVNTSLTLTGTPGLLAIFGAYLDEGKATTQLTTTPGATYDVSFDVRRIEYGGPTYPRHQLTVSAVDGGGSTVGSSGPIDNPTSPVTSVSFSFVAGSSGQTTLAIEGTLLGSNANQDLGFDNLMVTKQ